LTHFELIFVQGEKQGFSFSLLQVDNHFFPAPFVEEAIFCPTYVLGSLVKNQMALLCGFTSGSLFCSIGFRVCFVSISYWFCSVVQFEVRYCDTSSSFLLKIALAIPGLLSPHEF
jgi:hypothetical protein